MSRGLLLSWTQCSLLYLFLLTSYTVPGELIIGDLLKSSRDWLKKSREYVFYGCHGCLFVVVCTINNGTLRLFIFPKPERQGVYSSTVLVFSACFLTVIQISYRLDLSSAFNFLVLPCSPLRRASSYTNRTQHSWKRLQDHYYNVHVHTQTEKVITNERDLSRVKPDDPAAARATTTDLRLSQR